MKSLVFAVVALAAGAVCAALPKVMVMVDEKALGSISTSEVETMAVKMLGDKGVETVDRNMVQSSLDRVQKAFRGAGDSRAAAALGREFGAEAVLIGEAVAKPNAAKIGDSNLRSYAAAITLRAVRTDNAANVVAVSETATVVALDDVNGSSRALKAAGEKALGRLVPDLIAKWEKPNAKGSASGGRTPVTITVGGIDQMWELRETRLRFKGMTKEMESVAQKSYAQGMAVFSATSLLPTEELAEAIVMNPPADLRVQIVEIHEATISMRVVEAPKEAGDGN
jgi:hypothetical protein